MWIQEFVADVLPLSVWAIGVGAREAGLIPLPGYWLVRGDESVLPSQLLMPDFNVTTTQKKNKVYRQDRTVLKCTNSVAKCFMWFIDECEQTQWHHFLGQHVVVQTALWLTDVIRFFTVVWFSMLLVNSSIFDTYFHYLADFGQLDPPMIEEC